MTRLILAAMATLVGCAVPAARTTSENELQTPETIRVDPGALKRLNVRFPQGIAEAVGAPAALVQAQAQAHSIVARTDDQALRREVHQRGEMANTVVQGVGLSAVRSEVNR